MDAPLPAAHHYSEDVDISIRNLRLECDAWKARAAAYKAAFETQTKHLLQVVDVCVATQAELENERSRAREKREESDPSSKLEQPTLGSDGALDTCQTDVDWQSTPLTQANFGHIEQLLAQRHFSKARNDIDCLLPRPLSSEARVEALLLKSAICRASGPDWLLDALAQCSEALSLCDRLTDLEYLLPKIHFHRGLCQYQLRQLSQARNAFAAVEPASPLHDRATQYRRSCDEELDSLCVMKRRTAFEEHRTRIRRRSPSTRSRLFSGSKSVRLAIPHRWTSKAAT